MKHLTSDQLDILSRHWADTEAGTGAESRRRSRARLRVIFLLIRHAALRLGEALSLDDARDLDFAASTVRVNGRSARELPLPRPVAEELERSLDSPQLAGLRGRVTGLDQGYVRRSFYAAAEACGLPRDLLSPRVIRQSRGIELLRGNVPLSIVQRFLGRQSPVHAAAWLPFSDEEAERIVHHHLRREALRRTSARNAFTGSVSAVACGPVLTGVELTTLSGLRIRAIITSESAANLRITEGSLLTATVKAPWVLLAESGAPTSAGNSFRGLVREVRRDAAATEVIVELDEGTLLCALASSAALEGLPLAPGKEVFAHINALAVVLGLD